ncbi:VOC family protein [Nigerium massiliense]|uniref:VOC family protein n=1 Tax=Nigerium massiliense TaxID=1522317 RepID=UPI001C4847EC|nr:VOC family protein [Nigerium massiliense]
MGASADPALPRFVQLVLDVLDPVAARAFWTAALGYVPDRRVAVTDIVDPRRLGPVLVFQDLDPADAERRAQRNRIHLDLTVPSDAAAARVRAAVAAGGTALSTDVGRWRIADPEGNEVMIRGE